MERVFGNAAVEAHGSLSEYLLRAGYEGVARLAWAAVGYFSILTVLMTLRAGWEYPLLIAQKVVYTAVLLLLARSMTARRLPLRYFHAITATLLLVCLSSAALTVISGFTGHFEVYAFLLLLGVAMAETSLKWAVGLWLVDWGVWVLVSPFAPIATEHVLTMLGVQLIALTTLLMRIQLLRSQHSITERLTAALSESEDVRASLDQEVEKRTHQLTMAYEELNISIKERERLAVERERLAAERERLAGERERLQAQFLQSQKMESLGRLAGGVAHDFNNLLTVIMGNLQLAGLVGHFEPEVSGLMEEATIAARRAGELTGHLLAFSRSKVMSITGVSLRKIVDESIKMIERLLGEDIRLEVSLDCSDSVVDGDAAQLQQVLLNLAVNARDAMPQGGVLKIEVARQDCEVLLRMSDSGTEISAEIQQRIFEPFFTSKPVGKGTGLGLSAVHGIVSMHKGTIEVESRPGHGATFTVRLPARSQTLEDSSASRRAPIIPGSGRILLVEDDDQVRTLVTHSAHALGSCRPSGDGDQPLVRSEWGPSDVSQPISQDWHGKRPRATWLHRG